MLVVADDAAAQWGLFTTAQARAQGLTAQALARLADDGVVERLRHGVYRVTGAPPHPSDPLRAAWLALDPIRSAAERVSAYSMEPVDVVSHRSAAQLHHLGDLDADRLEFTTAVRRQTRSADVRFHRAALTRRDWSLIEGLPVTTVLRTITWPEHAWTADTWPARSATPSPPCTSTQRSSPRHWPPMVTITARPPGTATRCSPDSCTTRGSPRPPSPQPGSSAANNLKPECRPRRPERTDPPCQPTSHPRRPRRRRSGAASTTGSGTRRACAGGPRPTAPARVLSSTVPRPRVPPRRQPMAPCRWQRAPGPPARCPPQPRPRPPAHPGRPPHSARRPTRPRHPHRRRPVHVHRR
jgi:hypothetical protein